MIRAKWFALLLVGVVCCIGYSAGLVPIAMSSSQNGSDRKLRRTIDQSRIDEIKRHDLNLNNLRSAIIDDRAGERQFESSIVAEDQNRINLGAASSQSIPPSPGLAIGQTLYDYQHNQSQGYQVARMPGADVVHFVWHDYASFPGDVCDPYRVTYYNSYSISTGTLNQGPDGVNVGGWDWSGFPGGDVFDNNTFHLAMHISTLSYNPHHLYFPTPGSAVYSLDTLSGFESGGCPNVMWPRLATSRDGGQTVHFLARSHTNDCPTDLLWYWRYYGTMWTGPIILDSTPQISYVLADDPSGDKLAVAVHVSNHTSMNGINNVAYYESTTDGAGWIAGSEPKIKNVITNYNTDAGPGAWLHLTTAYDNAGILHIVWDEQEDANDNAKTAIRHWNSQRQTARTVALGYYETQFLSALFNLNLAKITLGIGDGSTMCQGGAESNEDYLYVLYTQFGGPTPEEEADRSIEGRYNGELYLTASSTGGNTWSNPANLTNTKTPNCNPGVTVNCTHTPPNPDSVCRSEHWATIGMAVSDIDIFFISDLDAGGIPQGEGTWQVNPVHYLRIPGGTTNAQHLCPLIQPNFDAVISQNAECEWNAGQSGIVTEDLTISNLGNGDLSGTINVTDFPGAATLSVSGSSSYSIIAGDLDDIRTVTMTANGAPEGLYQGMISITHNDPNEPSPREFPISFFVFNEFFCPQYAALKTGVASPGSLQMMVSNDGRFGLGQPEMGMWRHKDSSSSIDAGTLLIAHGTPGPDTTVFLRYGTRASNGQNGFRALGDLVIDTSNYSTAAGCANARAEMVTADSVVGMKIEWIFPQRPEWDEFIHAKLKLFRHNPAVPITNLAIGILADLDILPASRLAGIQNGVTNEPGSDGTRNLIWVGGVDSLGHIVAGQNTARRFRSGIGVRDGFEGAIIGNAVSDLQPGGGPTDGFLYQSLQNLAGIDLYSVSDTDLYAMISLDKGRSIAVGETLTYSFVLISDTISEVSLKATADIFEATQPTGCYCICDGCPCWADPLCDGIRSNIQDVVMIIDVAFRGANPVVDYGCPNERTDVDANGFTTVTDVVKAVNVAFRGQSVASNYVDPFSP